MTPPLLDHAAIARLIPHSGDMCLLHQLHTWDAQHIVCSAISHHAATNPMRTASGLLAPCAVEYAAQAMALHGALLGQLAGTEPKAGYLASMRGVRLHRLCLDDLAGPLSIQATRLAGDALQILYSFTVSHVIAAEARVEPVAEGRATVVLNTPVAA